MTDYSLAGRGLNYMFIGEILCILVMFPLIGTIAVLVGFVMMLVGLHTAGKADDGYRTAFFLTIVNLILSLIPFLGFVSSIFSIVVTYLVCTTTARLLTEKGDLAAASRGLLVWKLYLVCMVVSVASGILAVIPGLLGLAAAVSLLNWLAYLVGGILYIVFLYRASNSLMH